MAFTHTSVSFAFHFVFFTGLAFSNGIASEDRTSMGTESNTDDGPIWANEQRLGKYQHAEKVLSDTSTFNLVRATRPDRDQLWANTSKCVSREYHKENESYRTYFSFSDEKGETKNDRLRTMLTSTYGYNMSNAIQYELHDCSLVNDTVIFTSNGTCTLMSVQYKNEIGCELWANGMHLKNGTIPKCCYFLFDLLCASTGSYNMYNESHCPQNEQAAEENDASPTKQPEKVQSP